MSGRRNVRRVASWLVGNADADADADAEGGALTVEEVADRREKGETVDNAGQDALVLRSRQGRLLLLLAGRGRCCFDGRGHCFVARPDLAGAGWLALAGAGWSWPEHSCRQADLAWAWGGWTRSLQRPQAHSFSPGAQIHSAFTGLVARSNARGSRLKPPTSRPHASRGSTPPATASKAACFHLSTPTNSPAEALLVE